MMNAPPIVNGSECDGTDRGAAQPALMTVAVDETSPDRRGQSLAQYQCFYDLGIGVGSMVLGVLLDMVDQNFSIMYFMTVGVSLCGVVFVPRQGLKFSHSH